MTSRNVFAKATARDYGSPRIIPIVVRFVPHDQWFSTHIALSWTISQAKSWIIAKCFNDTDTLRILSASLIVTSRVKTKSHRSRPVSPITFATTQLKSRSSMFEDDEDQDPDFCDSDDDRQRSIREPPSRQTNPYIPNSMNVIFVPSSTVSSRPSISSQSYVRPNQPIDYCLLSFATSNILEDHYPVSWYNIRPHELLEVHPVGTFIRLRRDLSSDFSAMLAAPIPTNKRKTSNDLSSLSYSDHTSTKASSGLDEYIKPYFQASIKVLRIIRQPASLLQQGSPLTSPAKEEFTPSSTSNLISSPFSKAGKVVKSMRPYNNYDITTTEATMPDLSSPTDLLSEVGHVPEVNSNNKAHTNKLTSSAKRKASVMSDLGRTKFVWQDRWIIVRDEVLILCEKKEDVKSPSYSSSLSSLVALRGSEHLVHKFSSSIFRSEKNMHNRIVCAKFMTRQELGRKASAVSFAEKDGDDFEKKGKNAYHVAGLDDDAVSQTASSSGGSSNVRDKEDAVWLVIDTLDETVFEHLLRVLHRSACSYVNSSFLTQSGRASYRTPSRFASDISQRSITSKPSFSSFHQKTSSSVSDSVSGSVSSSSPPEHALASGIQDASFDFSTGPSVRPSHRRRDSRQLSYESWNPEGCLMYPNWRSEIVLRAWRASLNIGRGMELLICGDITGHEDDVADTELERRKRKRSRILEQPLDWTQNSDKSKTTALENSSDLSIMEEEDSEILQDSSSDEAESALSSSETEWEGWREDLQRQWTSMTEITEEGQLSDFHLGNDEDEDYEERGEWVRRRVHSDAGRPLSPLSVTIADFAATFNDDSILLPQFVLAPGSVTTSTVSVGRPPGRTRSSTVTESSHKKEIKEKKTPTKKGKQKEKSGAAPIGDSTISLQTSTNSSQPEDLTADTTTQTPASSSPVSTIFSSSVIVDPAGSTAEHTSLSADMSVSALTGENGEDAKGKGKKTTGLNNIVRSVSMRASAVKSKAKAVF